MGYFFPEGEFDFEELIGLHLIRAVDDWNMLLGFPVGALIKTAYALHAFISVFLGSIPYELALYPAPPVLLNG